MITCTDLGVTEWMTHLMITLSCNHKVGTAGKTIIAADTQGWHIITVSVAIANDNYHTSASPCTDVVPSTR